MPGYELPRGLPFFLFGLLYEARRASDPPRRPEQLWRRYHEASVREQALALDLPFARTLAAVYPLMRGERQLWLGQRPTALESFAEAGELAKSEEDVLSYALFPQVARQHLQGLAVADGGEQGQIG